MARFAIVTPTIGRETLRRCLMSMEHQVFKDFIHIVVGDGPQELWVRELCESKGVKYYETPEREGKFCFGAAPRNFALEKLENEFPCDYVIFLDDDNVLLEPTLYQANMAAWGHSNPPLLYQEILFTSKFSEEYIVIPKNELMKEREWDLLNGIYRSDTIRGIRFERIYVNDFLFAQAVKARLPDIEWIKIKGIGGIHHVSWDTYNG